MAKRDFTKKPLYRKVNRRTHGLTMHERGGGEFRWARNAKPENREAAEKGTLGKKHFHGLDCTPLYKFLLSRVGQPWDPTYREAVARLPKPAEWRKRDAPIFDMVYDPDAKDWLLRGRGMHEILRIGESTLFSTLCIDDAGIVQKVSPDLGVEHISPYCPCHMHTFNGVVVTNPCRNPRLVADGPVDDGVWQGYIRR